MKQSEGYHTPSSIGNRLVYKLSKALYDIRKAPRAWEAPFSGSLIFFGFSQSIVGRVVFTITLNNLLPVLAVYVDGCIIFGRNDLFIINFKISFAIRFDIEDMGLASWLLGFSIFRDRTRWALIFS